MLSEEAVRYLKPRIMKCSWPQLEKVDLERKVHEACRGGFGTPKEVLSFHAPVDEHYNTTNELFLNGGTAFLRRKKQVSPAEKKSSTGGQPKKEPMTLRFDGKDNPFYSDDNPFHSDESLLQRQSHPILGVQTPSVTPHFFSDRIPLEGRSDRDLGTQTPFATPNVGGDSVPDQDISVKDTDTKKDKSVKNVPPKEAKPPEPDRRALVISVLEDEGMSFEFCKDAEDLCDCLVHSMLGTVEHSPSLSYCSLTK